MVQLINLPSTTNMLAQSAGQGINQGLTEGVDMLLKKKGIRNAGEALNNPNSSPQNILTSLLEASIYNPEIGRNLGSLYGEAMKYRGAENQGQDIRNAGDNPISSQNPVTPSQSSPTINIPEQTEVKAPSRLTLKDAKPAEDYLHQIRPELFDKNLWGRIPKADFSKKQSLTPEEKSGLYDKLKHLPLERKEQVIQTIEQGIQNQYKENVSQYGFTKEEQAARDQKIQDASNIAKDELAPIFMQQKNSGQPSTGAVRELNQNFNRYLTDQPDYLTPQQMASNAMGLVQRDSNMLNVVRALPAMPPVQNFSEANKMIGDYAKAYKPLKDLGYTDALRDDAIYNKDLGLEGMHQAIWGEDLSPQTIKSMTSLKAPLKDRSMVRGITSMLVNNPREDKSHLMLANRLEEIQPKDDLILVRKMALDNGWDERQFSDALREAQGNGLELSPFQESQVPELSTPRKAPLWEIFNKGVGSQINYYRNKI